MEISIKNLVKLLSVLVVISLGLSGFSLYQVYQFGQGKSKITGKIVQSGSQGNLQSKVQQIKEEVLPKEGSSTGYGVKFSTSGMNQMVGWYQDIQLSGDEKNRYIELGTKDNTACEYCCGATKALRSDGQSACGCKHNYALAGLIKYLVKNTDYSNQEILEEVGKWKGYFFPKQTLAEELQKRDISPTAAGLPRMRGGC